MRSVALLLLLLPLVTVDAAHFERRTFATVFSRNGLTAAPTSGSTTTTGG